MRNIIKVWKESADGVTGYGGTGAFTHPGTPAINTDFWLMRIIDDSFKMAVTPTSMYIPAVDARGGDVQRIAGKYSLAGTLKTPFYPSQQSLVEYLLTPDATSGDLPSVYLETFVLLEDGSTEIRRGYTGVKAKSFKLTSTADHQYVELEWGLIGASAVTTDPTSTQFPQPAACDYPSEIPYLHTQLGAPGFLKLNGAAIHDFSSLEISVENEIDEVYNEQPGITRAKWCRRVVDYTIKNIYDSYAYRIAYEAGTVYPDCSAKFSNGTKTCTFDFFDKNYLDSVEDGLDFTHCYNQNLKFRPLFDCVAGTEMSIILTP